MNGAQMIVDSEEQWPSIEPAPVRRTGIPIIGNVTWGVHFCMFYETKQDLLDLVIPYFRAGLEDNEACLWLHSEMSEEELLQRLDGAVPNLDRHLEDGSFRFMNGRDWYKSAAGIDLEEVLARFKEELARARAAGFSGLRIHGNGKWISESEWMDLCRYEEMFSRSVSGTRMIAMCTYPLLARSGGEIFDLMNVHQFAVAARRGSFEIIETAEAKRAKIELAKLQRELEHRVEDRTRALEAANRALRAEIVQRTRAEEELVSSQLQFRALVDSIDGIVWEGNADTLQFTFVSKQAERILGYPTSQWLGEADFWERHLHPDDRELAVRRCRSATARQLSHRFEYRMIAADGRTVWIRDHVTVTFGAGGALRLRGVMMDITDRKSVEENLTASEERFRQLAENIREVFWIENLEMTELLYVSPAYEQVWGSSREDLYREPRSFLNAIHPDDRPHAQSVVEQNRTSGFDLEYRIIRPDGSLRWIRDRGFPIRDASGKIYRVVGIAEDITDRKEIEAVLYARKQEFKAFVENAPDLIFRVDRNFRYSYVNPATANAFQLPVAAFSGRPIGDPSRELGLHLGDEVVAQIREIAEKVFATGEAGETEVAWPLPEGMRTFALRLYPQRNPRGVVAGVFGIARDITEIKRAAEALREAESELARATRAATVGELTASISHEISQPLVGVSTNAEAGLRWLEPGRENLDEVKEAMLRILRDGNRAREVVTRIRALLQKGELLKTRVDIGEVIREIVGLTRGEFRRRNATLQLHLAPDLPRVRADRVQLQQVLLNLIVNALDAMSTLRSGPRQVDIRAVRAAHEVCVEVEDTGSGIDPAQMQRIFEPFYTTKKQGLGLGLSISRSIIEAHGGTLHVSGNPGAGVTFNFTLPVDIRE